MNKNESVVPAHSCVRRAVASSILATRPGMGSVLPTPEAFISKERKEHRECRIVETGHLLFSRGLRISGTGVPPVIFWFGTNGRDARATINSRSRGS